MSNLDNFFSKTSDRTSVYAYSMNLSIPEIEELLTADIYWRKGPLAEVYLDRLTGLKPQAKVIKYLQIVGTMNPEFMPKGISKVSVKCLLANGIIVAETKSRVRPDDMEDVYWCEIRLAMPLETAMKEKA